MSTTSDIDALLADLAATRDDAQALVRSLSEEEGMRPSSNGGWSVAECLDHLANANRVYIDSMREPATRARAQARLRRKAALPGLVGRLFVSSLEPPPKLWSKLKAPKKIRPRSSPPLNESFLAFLESHDRAVEFIRANADLDLASIRFANPFIQRVRFSLATGLHVIVAHERRHLLQARRAGRAMEA